MTMLHYVSNALRRNNPKSANPDQPMMHGPMKGEQCPDGMEPCQCGRRAAEREKDIHLMGGHCAGPPCPYYGTD